MRSLRQSNIAAELRFARTCYDHLAGALAVAITDALVHCEAIVAVDGCYRLGAAGGDLFTSLGVHPTRCAGFAAPSRIRASTGASGATTWPALSAPVSSPP